MFFSCEALCDLCPERCYINNIFTYLLSQFFLLNPFRLRVNRGKVSKYSQQCINAKKMSHILKKEDLPKKKTSQWLIYCYMTLFDYFLLYLHWLSCLCYKFEKQDFDPRSDARF